MRVKSLNFKNYRNLQEQEINFDEGINVIYGENAQGKTNILEAVWLLTGARSFRGTKDKDLVCFGKPCSYIDGKVEFNERKNDGENEESGEIWEKELKILLKDKKRMAEVNGVNRGSAPNIIGLFKAVIFSPEHLFLIKGGPENRRKFIDAAICQLKPSYATRLVRYNRILKHRNFLLKSILSNSDLEHTLEIWDKKLCEYGVKIISERIKYIDEIRIKAEKFYSEISKGEKLELSYTNWEKLKKMNSNEMAQGLFEDLKSARKTDISRGTTSIGPHRDEININIEGKSARLFGSQGQQRSGVIALKLSEAETAGELAKEPPVILLDDILSELDEGRQKQLFELAGDAQMIVTGCIKPDLSSNFKGFKVKKGKIFAEE